MIYKLDINDRAFKAIKEKRKRIEIRANKDNNFDYSKIKENDEIIFTSYSGEKIKCLVLENVWYKSIEELLILEGTRFTLSSTNDFNEGVKSINSLSGYKKAIKENGVYAIHLQYIGEELENNI